MDATNVRGRLLLQWEDLAHSCLGLEWWCSILKGSWLPQSIVFQCEQQQQRYWKESAGCVMQAALVAQILRILIFWTLHGSPQLESITLSHGMMSQGHYYNTCWRTKTTWHLSTFLISFTYTILEWGRTLWLQVWSTDLPDKDRFQEEQHGCEHGCIQC